MPGHQVFRATAAESTTAEVGLVYIYETCKNEREAARRAEEDFLHDTRILQMDGQASREVECRYIHVEKIFPAPYENW